MAIKCRKPYNWLLLEPNWIILIYGSMASISSGCCRRVSSVSGKALSLPVTISPTMSTIYFPVLSCLALFNCDNSRYTRRTNGGELIFALFFLCYAIRSPNELELERQMVNRAWYILQIASRSFISVFCWSWASYRYQVVRQIWKSLCSSQRKDPAPYARIK